MSRMLVCVSTDNLISAYAADVFEVPKALAFLCDLSDFPIEGDIISLSSWHNGTMSRSYRKLLP
jgi:hypothetical protein